MVRTNLLIILCFAVGIQNTYSQESVNASGNDICGDGGSISYSLGQVFYSVQTEPTLTLTQGVQQPNLTSSPSPNDLACYESILFDSVSCLYSIDGEMPEEPNIDCFETVAFDDVLCEWILEETIVEGSESYLGCSGDQYSIILNETLYDEANPSGEEMFTAVNGCDSLVLIHLIFEICDDCTVLDNMIELKIKMTFGGRYQIENMDNHTLSNHKTKDELITEILKRQTSLNAQKSERIQTHYSQERLNEIISNLTPNSQVSI